MIFPRCKQVIFFFFISGLAGCNSDYSFTRIKEIPDSGWSKDSTVSFDFKINRPVSPVDLMYQVQFNPDYSFENIWLDYKLVGPKGDVLTASRDNLNLFEPKTGKHLGEGSKDRIYLDAYFLKGIRLKDTGHYRLDVRHYMRQDNLSGIQSLGLKIRPSE